jgi:hypothetical protein
MTALDVDDFVAWLRERGVPDPHLRLYREGAEAVLRQVVDGAGWPADEHVEAAVQEAAVAGATARRLENLRSIGHGLLSYADERREELAAAEAGAVWGGGAGDDGRAADAGYGGDAGDSRDGGDGGDGGDGHDAFAEPEPPALELADVPRGDSRRARLARISGGLEAADGVRGTMIDDLLPPVTGEPARPESSTVSPVSGAYRVPPVSGTHRVPSVTGTQRAVSATSPPTPRGMLAATALPFDGPRPGVLASASRKPPTVSEPPLPGCVCRTRQDTYADDYWSMWGRVYLVITGTVGAFIAMFWNRMASMSIGLGVLAVGALATAATAGWRCTDCRRWIERKGLDDDQRRQSRTRALVFVGLAVAASIACVVAVHRLRVQLAEERAAMKVLDDLRVLDETGD